jgi:hypothetical protein
MSIPKVKFSWLALVSKKKFVVVSHKPLSPEWLRELMAKVEATHHHHPNQPWRSCT